MTPTASRDVNAIKLRAIEADIRAGKLQQAAAALNALASATPADIRIYLAGATLSRAAKNPKQEIESLRRVVLLAPRWSQGHCELAKALSRGGKHDEAVAAADTAVQLAPQEMMPLELAVAIAHAAGNFATAQRHLQTALTRKPHDTSIHNALGRCLTKQGLHGEAEAHWRAVLADNPNDQFALRWLASGLLELGRKEEASEVLKGLEALSPDEPDLQFHLAIARGKTPDTVPRERTQELFDEYAKRFDKQLVGELKYRLPRRVVEIIRARPRGLDVSILDLGCGTGLLGVYLGRVSGKFVGVDLSTKMLEQAARHNIYTELRQNDLLAELEQAAPESFDYVTADDVFVYVGDLSEAVRAAFKVLRGGGALIFSCETADESEGALILRPSKRYAHTRSSVETLCRDVGFSSWSVEPIDLRLEKNIAIEGFIVIAEKR